MRKRAKRNEFHAVADDLEHKISFYRPQDSWLSEANLLFPVLFKRSSLETAADNNLEARRSLFAKPGWAELRVLSAKH